MTRDKTTLQERRIWVEAGNCFVCNQKREYADVTTAYCLRHYILRCMRVRRLFIFNLAFYKSRTSRVYLERKRKRRFIAKALVARFVAIRSGGAVEFASLREVLNWIDDLWTALALWHSFPLRLTNLPAFVRLVLHLDHLAAGTFRNKQGERIARLQPYNDPSLADQRQRNRELASNSSLSQRD